MKSTVVPAVLVLASLAAASASAHRNVAIGDRSVLPAIAQAPAKARSRPNPYEGQPDAVAAGEKLFRQHCAECHGEDAHGMGRAEDLHGAGVQKATAGELAWFLWNGNLAKGMPSWSGLPEARRWQIISYIKSLPAQAQSSLPNPHADRGAQ